MGKACKWTTVGILWFVFFGLVALSGCVDVLVFMGSAAAAVIAARWYYGNLCTKPPEDPAGLAAIPGAHLHLDSGDT